MLSVFHWQVHTLLLLCYYPSYLQHSSRLPPCSITTSRSSTWTSFWTESPTLLIPSCRYGNTAQAPAMSRLKLTSRTMASVWPSLPSLCGGHVAQGLLPTMTECDGSPRTAPRLALASWCQMAWPSLARAALSSSQPSMPLSSTYGQTTGWLNGSPRFFQLSPVFFRADKPNRSLHIWSCLGTCSL